MLVTCWKLLSTYGSMGPFSLIMWQQGPMFSNKKTHLYHSQPPFFCCQEVKFHKEINHWFCRYNNVCSLPH
jgi:hypothetical protein